MSAKGDAGNAATPAPVWKTALRVAPFQVMGRMGEAFLPLFLAYWFGSTHETDAYYLLASVSVLLSTLFFGIFVDSAMIPLSMELRALGEDREARFLGGVLGFATAIGTVVALLFYLGCVALLPPSFHRIAAAFTCGFYAIMLRTFFSAIASASHDFVVPSALTGFSSVVLVGAVYLFRHIGIVVVPVAVACADALVAGLLYLRLKRSAVRVELNLVLTDDLRRLFRLFASEAGGSAIARINPVIDQNMAQRFGPVGSVTSLKFAQDVAFVPVSLLQSSLLSVLLPKMSLLAVSRDLVALRKLVVRYVCIVVALLGTFAAVLHMVREPILRVVFLHGKMDVSSVEKMGPVFSAFLAGIAPFGVLMLLVRAHKSLQNNRILVPLGLLNAVLNVTFNFIALPRFGIAGIAWSTTIVHTLLALLLAWLFRGLLERHAATPVLNLTPP
ncbi:MAG: polysaccharide biosynthesis C-terminal domain-containing protein [Polyangiaceae bacterium]|nr:polysaccharide biosynthesis C-terminal domain-containing protein [Polyangiaceae bacterium]